MSPNDFRRPTAPSARPFRHMTRDQIVRELRVIEPLSADQKARIDYFIRFATTREQTTLHTRPDHHFFVSCIILHPTANAVLLQYRDSSGEWDLPGGHIDNGAESMRTQSIRHAAMREAYKNTRMPDNSLMFRVHNGFFVHERNVASQHGSHRHLSIDFLMQANTATVPQLPTARNRQVWFAPDAAIQRIGKPEYAELAPLLKNLKI